MTNEFFAERMEQILEKAGDASGMCLTWHPISSDPDCVADFGCDADGYLVLMEDSFPLKIADLTNIRYRWNGETDSSDCFIRFDFGKDIHLDCCFSDYEMGHMYHVKYHDTCKICLDKKDAIALLEELKNKAEE